MSNGHEIFFKLCNLFQTSTSVNNLFVKMADHVLTSMDPTLVSVQPDGQASTANKVWNHGVV